MDLLEVLKKFVPSGEVKDTRQAIETMSYPEKQEEAMKIFLKYYKKYVDAKNKSNNGETKDVKINKAIIMHKIMTRFKLTSAMAALDLLPCSTIDEVCELVERGSSAEN